MHAASIAVVLLCGVIVAIVLLVRFGYFKMAYKRSEARKAEGAYEEVGDVSKSGFTIDVNTCYSLKQDPVYAEIEDVIKTKLNDAYASASQNVNQSKKNPSSILPPPITDQAQHMSTGGTSPPIHSNSRTPGH